jgi:hypothetical protein
MADPAYESVAQIDAFFRGIGGVLLLGLNAYQVIQLDRLNLAAHRNSLKRQAEYHDIKGVIRCPNVLDPPD